MATARSSLFAALLLTFGCTGGTEAAGIDYRDFVSVTGLSLVGAAQQNGSQVRLTPSRSYLAGAAWFRDKQPVSKGFESIFRFRLSDRGGAGGGADGVAFVLQNSGPTALGGRGAGGGFALSEGAGDGAAAGIPQSIAIFFDTFRNHDIGDPSNNFVTISTAGTPQEMRWPPPRLALTKNLAVKLKDGKKHTARISYQPPVLAVYLDDARVLVSTVDLSTVTDADGAAWVGFTASTGAGYENHDILSWTFSRLDADATMVSSVLSFSKAECLPGRNLCTPEHAVIDESDAGSFHIVLPGNVESGVSIPNPMGRPVIIRGASGSVCHDVQTLGVAGCVGPGALIQRTADGRTWFSVSTGEPIRVNEGYFEFEAQIQ
ncbi:MAG TPA: L-type lectin-domain containing protein [Bryobacteraceae bacterium]|jgi:hypothetical protein